MSFIQFLPENRLIRRLYTPRNNHADQDGEEDQRALDGCPSAVLLVFDGEGFEEEVEQSVDEGVVDGEAQDDGFGDQHHERHGEVLFHDGFGAQLFFVGFGV